MRFVLHFGLFELWRSPFLLPPAQASAYYLLIGAALVLVPLTLLRARRGYLVRRWPSLTVVGLVVLAPICAHVLVVYLWPGRFAWMTGGKTLAAPLLILLPVALAAAYTRTLEAVCVGTLSSLCVALWFTHNSFTCLEGAYLSLWMHILLTQPYKGRLPQVLRQPVVAAPLALLLSWPVMPVVAYASTFGPVLTSAIGATDLALSNAPLLFAQAILAGIVLQLLYLTPLGRPVPVPSRIPPHARSVRASVLAAYLPAAAIAVLAVVGVLLVSAVASATEWALAEAARDASSAAQRLERSMEQEQNFLALAAQDKDLAAPMTRADALRRDLQSRPSYSGLLLLDRSGDVLAAALAPDAPAQAASATEAERAALANLAPERAAITPIYRGPTGPMLSLISPLGRAGRLLARMEPSKSELWQDVLAALQWTADAGNGFIVDDQRHIVAHPDPTYVLSVWDAAPQYARYYATSTGRAYDAPDSTGARHLVYTLNVTGYPWQVVIEVPTEAILQLALDLALPMLAITGALAAVGTLLAWVGAWRFSRQLQRLTATAGEIAAGDLTVPVEVSGHDEIGRLGRSFEEMRLSLHRRLSDLALLLDVVRSVSASQDWSFQPILRAAVSGSQATAACILLDEVAGGAAPVAREGEFSGWRELLPQVAHIAREVRRRQQPLPVRNLLRYLQQPSPETVAAGIQSAMCLPVTAGQNVVGVMWVLYPDRRHFDEQDVRFLATLAGQAGVVSENARLLAQAQGERGRLRAILTSTADPILVVDERGKLVLANPAAEQVFGLSAEAAGQPVTDLIRDASLHILLETPLSQSCLTRELRLDNGATLYAAVSPVALGDGRSTANGRNHGRVIVMRDVSELKQREAAQADFVSTLSGGLRMPLNRLRGWASMIARVGGINQQQEDMVEMIVDNVDHVSGMLDNLVDLNAIELGEGATLERCSVRAAIEVALSSVRNEIEKRQHSVRLSLPQTPVLIEADRNLLVRALTALCDNAAKYMADGGTIGIEVRHQEGGVTVIISDRGIGIAPADQMRVFDRFYRVDRPEVKKVPGYGLGLAIAKAIATWHGGRLWLESEPGKGSSFYLWLPRHEGMGTFSP